MKVVAISCSPRINGSCDVLIEETLRGIRDRFGEVEVDKFKLSNLKINDCRACESCKTLKSCCQRDDMQRIYEEIYKSEVIIFASPIYMGYITGTGKNFVDRMYAFNKGHYEVDLPGGKKVIIILTQGHKREDAYRRVMDDLTNFFNGYGVEISGRIIAAGVSNESCVDENLMSVSYNIGRNI